MLSYRYIEFFCVVFTLSLFAPLGSALEPYADKPTAFVNVSVISMANETVLEHQTVLINDGKIVSIGPMDATKVPRKATKIDGEGKYLVPGLIDLHAHFFAGRKGNMELLPIYLNQGVTTLLNMKGSKGILTMREQVDSGEVLGPEIYTTTPILGNASPYPATFDEAVTLTKQFHAEGYDFVKVYNQIPAEGYRGIIETAEKLDFPVVGHAVRSVMLEGVLNAKQDLAHMEEIIYGYFPDELDESKIPELTQHIKNSGISIIATLIAYHNIIRQIDDIESMINSPGVSELPTSLTRSWQAENNTYLKRFSPESNEAYLRPSFAFIQKLTKAFHEAGIPILMGTDACISIVVPGYSAHDELQELVDAGLSPYAAMASATREAAIFLNAEHEIGTIEVGKRADLLLLNANPLENIEHTRKIEGVMTRGKWLPKQ